MNNENNGINTTNNVNNSNDIPLNNNSASNTLERLDFIEEEVEALNEFSANQNIETLDNHENVSYSPVEMVNESNNLANVENVGVNSIEPVGINSQDVGLVNENSANTNNGVQIPEIQNSTNATTITNSNGVIAPSIPVDSTGVGFVATSTPLKKKKNPLIKFGIIFAVLIVLSLIGYFFVYPFVVKNILNDPKKLFDTAITQVSNELISFVDENVHNKQILDAELEIESDIEALKDFSGYKYGGRFGIDPNNKLLEIGYSVENEYKEEYNQYYYIKNGEHYTRYSSYRNLIRYGSLENEELAEFFTNLTDMFDEVQRVNNEDLKYLINKSSELLKNTINENNLSKEDASVTINGEALKVIKNKYTLNKDTIINTKNYISEGLSNDTKVIEIMTKMLDLSEDEVKSLLQGNYSSGTQGESLEINLDNMLEEIPDDYVMTISIFTYGNAIEVVGYEITDNKSNNLHYYTKNNNFELVVNTNNEMEINTLKVIGTNANGKINVVGNYNEVDIFNLVVTSAEKNNVILDYTIIGEDENITGSINYNRTITAKNYKVNLDFEVNFNKDKTKINLVLSNDWSSEVANVNIKTAKDLTLEELNNIESTFKNYINKTPLGSLNETIGGDRDDDIDDYYDDNLNNDKDDDIINNGSSNSIIEKAENMKMCQVAICPTDCVSGYCVCTYYGDNYSQNITCFKR